MCIIKSKIVLVLEDEDWTLVPYRGDQGVKKTMRKFKKDLYDRKDQLVKLLEKEVIKSKPSTTSSELIET